MCRGGRRIANLGATKLFKGSTPLPYYVLKMKQIYRKQDLLKENENYRNSFNRSLRISDFIDTIITKIIKSNLIIYENLLSKEKNSIKIKYFYDRIEDYKNYLKFYGDIHNEIASTAPLAFYSSTTNLINSGNYNLRINFMASIFGIKTNPLFIFLEEPIFHSKKEFKITILREKLVLDFKENNFSDIKKNISYWEKKMKRYIGSYIENSQINNKDWLKDRYYAVFDFILKSILESDSYEEMAQRIAIDCLLSDKFMGIISSQSVLIDLIKNKVDFKTLFDNKDIEIDIIKCSVCSKAHKGPLSKDITAKLPCDGLSLQIILNSKIRFKKALLPFITLSYLGVIPVLSNLNYIKNIDKFRSKDGTNNDAVFLLNKLKFKSIFGESINFVNLLAEGSNNDLYENVKKWDNEKDISLDNKNFYKIKGKQTNFVDIKKFKTSEEISNTIKKMEELRSSKKWQNADAVKMKLIHLGIDIIESKGETLVREIS